MKMLVLLLSLLCMTAFAQGKDVQMKDEKEFNPGQTIAGEGKLVANNKPAAKICYETIKDSKGKDTLLQTDRSMELEEKLDTQVYELIRKSLQKQNTNWKDLRAKLDRISPAYCEQMFVQSISDGFLRYTYEVKADDQIDQMITRFIAAHPSDAAKPRGGWSIAVLDQYHQKMFNVLQEQTKRHLLAKKELADTTKEMNSFATPVRIGDKTIPSREERPLETAAEAEM